MDNYKCENCGKIFDEFEMNFKEAQIDKKCLCATCRELSLTPPATDRDYGEKECDHECDNCEHNEDEKEDIE